jgi:hypothetical protein
MKLERLRDLTCSTLALCTREPARDVPEVVLVHEAQAGTFMIGASVRYESRGEEKLWLTASGVRLRGLSALITFRLYGEISVDPYAAHNPPALRIHSIDRSDDRASTNAQWSKVADLAREAHACMSRDIPALWEAVDWVLAEARVKSIAESIAALDVERASLEEKLKGRRPW